MWALKRSLTCSLTFAIQCQTRVHPITFCSFLLLEFQTQLLELHAGKAVPERQHLLLCSMGNRNGVYIGHASVSLNFHFQSKQPIPQPPPWGTWCISFCMSFFLPLSCLPSFLSCFPSFFLLKIIYLLGLSCGMQDLQLRHVGSSSLTRDGTQALCIGSMESWSLIHQGSPVLLSFFLPSFLSFFLHCLDQKWAPDPRVILPRLAPRAWPKSGFGNQPDHEDGAIWNLDQRMLSGAVNWSFEWHRTP